MAEYLDQEEWRNIPGFAGYQASSFGRVKSLKRRIWNSRGFFFQKRERILKTPNPDKNGYLSYCLRIGASASQPRKRSFLAHRLVALAFIPNPENKPFINHKNGVKANCRPDNLEWCTKPENGQHAVMMGLHTPLRGEANGHSRLTTEQVLLIRSKYQSRSGNIPSLAREFNIGRTTVGYIINRKLWAHV